MPEPIRCDVFGHSILQLHTSATTRRPIVDGEALGPRQICGSAFAVAAFCDTSDS
jgi:hypothetical protein